MNINIAIIRAISSGKTTLLNSIFGKTLSDMNIIRTTMIPTKYNIKNNIDDEKMDDFIFQKNKGITEKYSNTIWNYDNNDICNYDIPQPKYFVKTYNSYNLQIFDLPGLNYKSTKIQYYNYVKQNTYIWNIIYFVVDINSGFNTSDEIDILNMIIDMMKQNPLIHVIIVMNKCDFMMVDEDNQFKIEDDQQYIYEYMLFNIQT